MAELDVDTDQLLARCSSGDDAATDQLMQRHRDRLRRMVQAHFDPRLAGRLDPSDVVQEALAEAAMKMPDYLADRPIAFYPWLRQIAWERLVRLHEKHIFAQKRTVDREIQWQPRLNDPSVTDLALRLAGGGDTPSAVAIRDEMVQRVRQTLDEIPSHDRQLITLRYIEQLSFRDVASVLGISEGAAKTRHFRIIQRLHDLLTPSGEGGQS